jgi:Flp pilus assembly protein TadD
MQPWNYRLLIVAFHCVVATTAAQAGFPFISQNGVTPTAAPQFARQPAMPWGTNQRPSAAPATTGATVALQRPSHVANPFVYAPRTSPTQMSPAVAAQHLAQALQFESQNNVRMAIHSYHRALESDPTNRLALISFARMKHRIGDLDGAIATYRQSLKLHPNDAVALNDLGLCHARRGEIKNAIHTLAAAARLDSSSRLYANNLATVLVEDRSADQALTILQNAHGLAIGHYNLALILKRRGDRSEAIQQVSTALDHDPSLSPAQHLLAELGAAEPEGALRVAALPASALGGVAPEPTAGDFITTSGNVVVLETESDRRREQAHWNFLQDRESAMQLSK